MSDQCEHCECLGDLHRCEAMPCFIQESWYVYASIAKLKHQLKCEKEINQTKNLTITVFYANGDDPFIFRIHGDIDTVSLGDIEKELIEHAGECFDKGDGEYLFSVSYFGGQYGPERRCEIAPSWEFEEIKFLSV